MTTSPAKGLVALLRLPYWLMTGGLALLTSLAILTVNGNLNATTLLLTFFSMAFITSAGFAINDYYDKESDAVIKPQRPLPSGALSLRQVVAVSALLFGLGLALAFFINWLSFAILAVDSMLLLVYSALVKRKSGFVANVLVGVLTGTAFMYGEATVTSTVSLVSLSLYPIAFGTIGGNVLRDVLSLEGDSKVGYPTLPQTIGNTNAVKVAAVFFTLTGVLAPLPYFLGNFGVYYLPLILLWSVLLIYSSVRLVTSVSTVANVRRHERVITMSMILLPLALNLQSVSPLLGGLV